LTLLLATGCSGSKGDGGDDSGSAASGDPVAAVDEDGDRFSEDEDCDDRDPAVNPGAPEVLDCTDNDCDPATGDDPAEGLLLWVDAAGEATDLSDADLTQGASLGAGTLVSCGGTWVVELAVDEALTVIGGGPDVTRFESRGRQEVLQIDNVGEGVTVTGATLSGGQARAIDLYRTTLALTDVHIVDSETSDSGGGIYADSSHLVLRDSELTGNTAGNAGGGIAASSSTVELVGVRASGNTAARFGGGIYVADFGGGLIAEDLEVTDNAAEFGGGMYMVGDQTFRLDRFVFSGNEASIAGGLHLRSDDAQLSDGAFTSNVASDIGGAIYCKDSVSSTGLAFTGNEARNQGGAVYTEAPFDVAGLTVTENSAREGGGFFLASSGTLEATDAGFSDNSGGDIYLSIPDSEYTVTSDTVSCSADTCDEGR
jgi:predicted outer membrane repeat protein